MDDLTNCFNFFVTTDDYCSNTNLASSIHPRLAQYKKSSTKPSQEERRNKILIEQKKKRKLLIEHHRDVESSKQQPSETQPQNVNKTKKLYKKAPYQLMFSEWLEEIPFDFETNWIMVMCPVGKRCLVVASEGTTIIFNKGGKIINKHRSKLPGGNGESKIDETILDCVYSESTRTYYVLDCLCWKSHPILDTEAEFRFYWLKCKLDETNCLNTCSFDNPYKFEDIPRFYGCKKSTIEASFNTIPKFQLDGILFYHKEAHYESDYTPLVGWLKPYMLPEILNVNVPQHILATAPSDYINAKKTISNSNIEIERFKVYLHSKILTAQKQQNEELNELSPASSSTVDSMEVNGHLNDIKCTNDNQTCKNLVSSEDQIEQ